MYRAVKILGKVRSVFKVSLLILFKVAGKAIE